MKRPKGLAVDPLETRWIRLVPFDERDHFDAYLDLRNDGRLLNRWSGRRSVLTRHQLEDEIRGDMSGPRHLFLSILSKATWRVVGFVYDYSFAPILGHTWVTTVIASGHLGMGYGAHAESLFMPFLFEQFNLRKIYCEVYSDNDQSQRILRRVGFREEACLRDHALSGTGFTDLFILALHKNDLGTILDLRRRLQERCQRGSGPAPPPRGTTA